MNLIPDDIDFSKYLEETEYQEIQRASDYLSDTLKLAFPDPNTPKPPEPLWDKCRGKIAFRPGEVTLWAGINGHGKSMMLSQVTLDLLYQHQRVLVISLEMTPAAQMLRMSRQAHAGEPTRASITELHKSTDDLLWIYNQTGSIGWKKIMAICRYAREKFGIQHFIIDSLMKAVRGEDDLNGQKDFIDDICGFALAKLVHMHIVHHVRKGETEYKIPDKYDIRGSSSIIDQVDNILIVFRDKKAEQAKDDQKGTPTACLKVVKNRHGSYEGILGFWFDIESFQYLENPTLRPNSYVIKNNYPRTFHN